MTATGVTQVDEECSLLYDEIRLLGARQLQYESHRVERGLPAAV